MYEVGQFSFPANSLHTATSGQGPSKGSQSGVSRI